MYENNTLLCYYLADVPTYNISIRPERPGRLIMFYLISKQLGYWKRRTIITSLVFLDYFITSQSHAIFSTNFIFLYALVPFGHNVRFKFSINVYSEENFLLFSQTSSIVNLEGKTKL